MKTPQATPFPSQPETAPAQDWLTLDNAAKIYPAVTTDSSPTVFRLSATLRDPINVAVLQDGLHAVMRRFPYYQVHLRRGFFWYYLERHQTPPRLRLMGDSPVSNVSIRRRGGHLFQVSARGNTVAIDISHILTDGSGGMRFLATLLGEYQRRRGISVPATEEVPAVDEPPDPEEWEDAYKRYFRHGTPGPPALSPAYHIPHRSYVRSYRVIEGRTSLTELRSTAKRFDATITEYLVAVYLASLAEICRDETGIPNGTGRRPSHRSVLRIEVPVNMRRIHPSRTMRNFSLFVSPELDLRLGSYEFEEIVKTVHHQMRQQLDHRELGRQMARNVSGELSPIIRAVPLVLKDIYLAHLHHRMGPALYSGVVSNLGGVVLPESLLERIESIRFVLGPNVVMKKNCAVVSWGDTLGITFGSVVENRRLERLFFTRMVRHGLSVAVSEH
jgi:hypothetical protein